MKRILTYIISGALVAGMVLASCGRSSPRAGKNMPADTTGTAVITFQSLEHNFGQVKEGERVGCIFTYTNTGDADLVLTAATASCGCTVPKYSKKPVPPGGTGTIEAIFDTSGREGLQTKTVVVQSNAENNLIILRIIAEVMTGQTINK
jgi:hypothetical protein